eukprot:TRINITY_DN904_c0_g1_i1.p1 TRINITY_DN904_c0_g1~~TRINITY_DN904_c0_g1_i1.p1  ORF type:complete len:480 (-),score=179.95 TRINITY_DN904_c0_g1_i1:2094-3509(-)
MLSNIVKRIGVRAFTQAEIHQACAAINRVNIDEKSLSLVEQMRKIKGDKQPIKTSMAEAVKAVNSGDRVYVHMGTPVALLDELTNYGKDNLKDIELIHLLMMGNAPHTQHPDVFRSNALFISGNVRGAVGCGESAYTPIMLHQVPHLFEHNVQPCDVSLVQVTPPNEEGYCSIGYCLDATRSAIDNSKIVIAQINDKLPFCYGEGMIHVSHFDYMCEHNEPIMDVPPAKIDDNAAKMGKWIADNLVEDGATLQIGIGGIPDAVTANLKNHKHMGVHTEMFSDGIVDLVDCGAIDGSMKNFDKGLVTTTFVMGTDKTYNFIDRNPMVKFREVAFTNNPANIARQPKFTAINSAIEVDITGQIVSDSIGTRAFSGFGGQVDFIYGASMSEGGKAVIALPSSSKGISRIVPMIKPGAGVVTTRGHAHHIVTEHGGVDLFGQNLQERARLMISIADPAHQEELHQAAFERLGVLV